MRLYIDTEKRIIEIVDKVSFLELKAFLEKNKAIEYEIISKPCQQEAQSFPLIGGSGFIMDNAIQQKVIE